MLHGAGSNCIDTKNPGLCFTSTAFWSENWKEKILALFFFLQLLWTTNPF